MQEVKEQQRSTSGRGMGVRVRGSRTGCSCREEEGRYKGAPSLEVYCMTSAWAGGGDSVLSSRS